MFPEMKSRETLRFEGNKIHCSAKQNESKFEKRAEIPATMAFLAF